jgi:tetratricopeptide (TPR) repeat protein
MMKLRTSASILLFSLLGACAADGGERPVVDKAREMGNSRYGFFLAARHAQMESDNAVAADFFSQVLKSEPDNIEIKRRAYQLMAGEGRMETAERLAKDVLATDKDTIFAAFLLASREVKRSDFVAAEKYLADMPPGRGIGTFMFPLTLAWVKAGQGKFDDALKALAPLKDTKSLHTVYEFHSGLIQEIAGREDEAAVHYANTMASPGGLSVRAVSVVSALHMRQGQVAKARAVKTMYRQQHPDSLLLDSILTEGADAALPPIKNAREGLAEAFFGVAGTLRQGGIADLSLMLVRMTLDLQPEFELAQILLAETLEEMNRLSEANKIYASMPKDSPLNWFSRLRQAENLYRDKKASEAVPLLEDLAKVRLDRPEPLITLGDIKRSEKLYEEAVAAYSRAIERVDAKQRRSWSVFYSRGIAYERAKMWDKAEKDFEQALKLNPDQPHVLNYLAYSWVDQGIRLDEAREMLEKASSQRPRDGYIVDSVGWVLYRLGDFPGAVKKLERAIELKPDDPVINDHLGDALWKVGRREEAYFQWQRALVFEPEPEEVDKINAKIKGGLDAVPSVQLR